MSLENIVPKEYGYVLLTATATFLVSTWHGVRVSSFRKPAKITYPQDRATPYDIANAKDEPDRQKAMYLFNCAQRAHANFMENYIMALPAMLIAGTKFPLASAVTGAVWTVSRIVYARGYTRVDRERGTGRLQGLAVSWLAQLVLYGLAGWSAASLLL